MDVTLSLDPEIERGLIARAHTRGVSLDDYLHELVAREARLPVAAGARPIPRRDPLKRSTVWVAVVVSAMVVSSVLLAQSNPFLGTWKLNLAKSKFSPGPPPLNQTTTIEAVAGGTKHTTRGVAANGSAIFYSYTNSFADKDEPIEGTGPSGSDTISAKRIDPNTTEATYKKAGKIVQTSRSVVSKVGNTRTVTSKGMSQSGQVTSSVTVYDKR